MFIDGVYTELLKKKQFLSLSQTEGKSVSPRFPDRNFYIKFDILLVL
jgi:hypothetical protein